jgi:hypothetical protein
MNKHKLFLNQMVIVVIFGVLGFTACQSEPPEPPPDPVIQVDPSATLEKVIPTEPEPTHTLPPSDTPEPFPTIVPPTSTQTEETVLEPLPPDPQEITFQAEDGFTIFGRYYPAVVNPAPMIVLMHWAPGDMEDWNEIAFWLQNRGLTGTSSNLGQESWLDPSWFPGMIEGQSFGVFTFSFRECDAGCNNFQINRPLWLLDATAAMQIAAGLEGVDSTKLIAIGASIGADGATDGCFRHNDLSMNSCLAALSISPGDYLTVPYADAVSSLMEETPPKHDWCLWATGDVGAAGACNSAMGDQYLSIEWAGSAHGMDLFRPEVEPNVLLKILDFITLVYGL